MRELGLRRIKSQWNKTLESAGLILLLAESNEMIDAIFHRFDMPVEHGRICFKAGRVNLPGQIQPARRVALVGTDHRARRLPKYFSSASRARIKTGIDQLSDHILIIHFVKMSEVIEFDHRESFQMELWIFVLQGRKQVRKVTQREFRIQAARDVQFGGAFANGLAGNAQTVLDVMSICAGLPWCPVETAELAIDITNVCWIEVTIYVEVRNRAVLFSAHMVRELA